MSGFIVEFLHRRRNHAIKMDDSDVVSEDTNMAKKKKAGTGAPKKGMFRGGERSPGTQKWFQINTAKEFPLDQLSAEFLRMIIFRAAGKEYELEQAQEIIDKIPVVQPPPTPVKVGYALGMSRRRMTNLYTELAITDELQQFCDSYSGEISEISDQPTPNAWLNRDPNADRSAIQIFPRGSGVLDRTISDFIAMIIFRAAGDELLPEAIIDVIHEIEPSEPGIRNIETTLNVTAMRLRNTMDHLGIRGHVKLMIKERRLEAKTEAALKEFKKRLNKTLPDKKPKKSKAVQKNKCTECGYEGFIKGPVMPDVCYVCTIKKFPGLPESLDKTRLKAYQKEAPDIELYQKRSNKP